jgi:hypothetical protein
MSSFFDLTDEEPNNKAPNPKIGSALKKEKLKTRNVVPKPEVLDKVAERSGFDRKVNSEKGQNIARRRGRPPLNEEMTYWRIYLKPSVRDKLCLLRDSKGIRLNDLLEDILEAYENMDKI